MIGALTLWSQRRKLRGSLGRDPLLAADPTPWLDDAGSVMHLRASCPEPSWLVHCAYWAGIKQDGLYAGVVAAARHIAERATEPLFAVVARWELRVSPFDTLAGLVRTIEKSYPAIRGIEQCIPSAGNLKLLFHLGEKRRRPGTIDAASLTPDELIAAGMVLVLVATFHRAEGLREALALCCGAAATFFALAMPRERQALLDLQRDAYGWPSTMTTTTFVK